MKLSSIKKINDLGRLLNASTLWYVTNAYPYEVKAITPSASGPHYVAVDKDGAIHLDSLRNRDMIMAGGVLDVFDDELEAKKFASALRLKYLREELAKEKAKKRKK